MRITERENAGPGGSARTRRPAPLGPIWVVLLCGTAAAQQAESLHYNVNWPSGLSLGEASLTAQKTGAGWDLAMTLDAAIPGFRIADRFHSVTNPQLCSLEFTRDISQGSKKWSDKNTFDSGCVYDALAFLFALQWDLVQGTLPPPGQIFYGRTYSIRMERSGQQSVTVNGKLQAADGLSVHLTGSASSSTFEIYFARDAARTPVLARIPTNLGTITVELSP